MNERLEQLIEASIEAHKDKPCIWWDGVWRSSADFLNLVDSCGQILKDAGFGRGQRPVVMMNNGPMIPALSLAVWRLGGAFCPLNVAAGQRSLTETISLIEPFAVVMSDEVRANVGEALQEQWPCAIAAPDKLLSPFKGKTGSPESDDLAVIFATSGTTGNPKAVPLTHGNFIDNCRNVWKTIDCLKPGDVFLTVLPNFHSFGYTVTNIMPLMMGGRLAMVPAFLPPQPAMRAIQEAPVDVVFAVPAIFSYMLASVERGKFPAEALTRTKFLCAGGDRLNPKLHEQALHLINKDIVEGYGLTETTPVVAVNPSYAAHHPGTVGPVIPGYTYKLRDREGRDIPGSPLNPKEGEGVLWVKGPSVTHGYFRAPGLTAERFDGENHEWFNTGDYIRMENGYVKILDRVTDIIIVGGFNVYPQEVEKVLAEHPAVQTAIVVGVPHPTNGEIPEAYIQRREGAELTERELIKFAKERLAHYKVPRRVEFVDEFPLSGTGKILRRVLREQAGKKGL
ncbi:MAG: AMP-binding protein [Fretibacterium sp.]|nr:AMP-binding protein [Fretibacterium sp.]